jgi:hypothetical protein
VSGTGARFSIVSGLGCLLCLSSPLRAQGDLTLSNLVIDPAFVYRNAITTDVAAQVSFRNNTCYSGGSLITPDATVTIEVEWSAPTPFENITDDLVTCQVRQAQGTCQAGGTFVHLFDAHTARLVARMQQNGPGNCNQSAELSRNLTIEDPPLVESSITDVGWAFGGLLNTCYLFTCFFLGDCDFADVSLGVIVDQAATRTGTSNARAVRAAELNWKLEANDPLDPDDDTIRVLGGRITDLLQFVTDFELPQRLQLGVAETAAEISGTVKFLGQDMAVQGSFPLLQAVLFEQLRYRAGGSVPAIRVDLLPQAATRPSIPRSSARSGSIRRAGGSACASPAAARRNSMPMPGRASWA